MRLPEDESLAAGRLRLREGVEVCAAGDGVWLRGPQLEPALVRALRGLPGAVRFHVDAQGRLTPVGKRLPTARLPAGPWTPIASWLTPRAQTAHPGATEPPRARLAFVRTGEPGEPAALLVEMADWARWALDAPEVRLKPLKFAVSEHDQVLVMGAPLPPVRGTHLVSREGVLVPAGWGWTPPVDAAEVRALFGAATGDVLLFDLSGGAPLIEASAFVKATRSAVRLSTRKDGDGPA